MDYEKIYFKIIEHRKINKFDGYTEKHHIIPRSLGGSDDKDNLVDLSAREHYICHLLLVKIYEFDLKKYYKMLKGYNMMCNAKSDNQFRSYTINSKIYAKLKKDFSIMMSNEQKGNKNSQYATKWIFSNALRETKRVKSCYILHDDWTNGRVYDFEYLDRLCKKCNKHLNCKSNKELKKYCSECSKKVTESKRMKLQNNSKCKKCFCDGVIFDSVGEASRVLNVNAETLRRRIKSKNNENYYYV